MTIANNLHGKIVEQINTGKVKYDPQNGIYEFEDGSQAKVITRYVDCEPFVTSALSTLAKKKEYYWKAI